MLRPLKPALFGALMTISLGAVGAQAADLDYGYAPAPRAYAPPVAYPPRVIAEPPVVVYSQPYVYPRPYLYPGPHVYARRGPPPFYGPYRHFAYGPRYRGGYGPGWYR